MSALGLAIMIVAGAVTLDVVLENTRNTDASVVGQTVSNVDLGGFFTAGVLVGIALMLGLMLLLAGIRRANRKRLERKELTRSFEGTAAHMETLQEERDRLAAELEQERAARSHQQSAAVMAGDDVGRHETGTHETAAHVTGTHETAPHETAPRETAPHETGAHAGPTHEIARDEAPIYPTDAPPTTAPGAGTPSPAGTATQERTKPTLKQRLLGH